MTFSVLPAELIPRHGCSLALVTRILSHYLREDSMAATLDALADSASSIAPGWFPDPVSVYRLLRLGLRAEARLG
ncbi:MAG: hypothetical protein AAGN66_29640, partial [Acidobacteriota bacterium]